MMERIVVLFNVISRKTQTDIDNTMMETKMSACNVLLTCYPTRFGDELSSN